MIKLRVEWHHTCPDCSTRIVVDLMTDANGFRICPWCGRIENDSRRPADPAFRSKVSESVARLEDKANLGLLQTT